MRRIVLDIISNLSVRIIEQTERGERFTSDSRTFLSSNGLRLNSTCTPEVSMPVVFVRGTSSRRDLDILSFESPEDINSFLFAVDEYNTFHNGNVSRYLVPPNPCTCKSAIMCEVCLENPEEALNF